MSTLLSYQENNTWIHKLNGITKFLFFITWSIIGMITYDTRLLLFMFFVSIILYSQSKIKFKTIEFVFKMIVFFLVLNILFIFLFAPYQGTLLYGTKTVVFDLIGNYSITYEQLFYEFNVVLKYLVLVPTALIFILATNPSEFASSLNSIGVSYKISYAVSLTLRYIPDIKDEFTEIKNSQEARGIDMSNDVNFFKRVASLANILFPLIMTSMDKIDSISNAMQLRGFGKNNKRTWYYSRKLTKVDKISLFFIFLFLVISIIILIINKDRFYNPFI